MTQANAAAVPVEITDPVNARILAVSEDRLPGFQPDPFGEIARLSGVELETVLERIRAMLSAGVIRRVRQTMLATNLAPGALVAWRVPQARLDDAFEYMFREDPFSRPRRAPLHRSGDSGLRLPPVDHPQGAAGLLHAEARRLPARPGGRGGLSPDARPPALHPGRGPRAAARPGAGRAQRRARRGARHQRGGTVGAGVAGARPAQARAGGARGLGEPVECARRGGRRPAGRVPADGTGVERARRGGPVLHLPGAREALRRRTPGDALQRALPLAGAPRPRDRSRQRGGAATS
jgi:hypothetical protein